LFLLKAIVLPAEAHHYATQLTEDPAVFGGKTARFRVWRKVDGEYVYPYECGASFDD